MKFKDDRDVKVVTSDVNNKVLEPRKCIKVKKLNTGSADSCKTKTERQQLVVSE